MKSFENKNKRINDDLWECVKFFTNTGYNKKVGIVKNL